MELFPPVSEAFLDKHITLFLENSTPDWSDKECSPVSATRMYEKNRITGLAAEREHVQKKTFTKWANSYLSSTNLLIEDLFFDLRDGRILLKLLEIISGKKLSPPTPGRMRIHNLENVEKVLNFLSDNHIHLENLGAHDIVDGNPRLILGLMWMIILRFQIQDIMILHPYEFEDTCRVQNLKDNLQTTRGIDQILKPAKNSLRRFSKDGLQLWCQIKTTGYPNVRIDNFCQSWCNGLAFNAIIHRHYPDLFDFNDLDVNDSYNNLEHAFEIAESLGIHRLFDPEDILKQHPDEKSILTYVASYYHFFTKQKLDRVNNKRISNLINQIGNFFSSVHNYESSSNELLAWIYLMIEDLDNRDFAPEPVKVQQQMVAFTNYRLLEKPPRLAQKSNLEMDIFNLRNKMQTANFRLYNPPSHLSLTRINRAWIALEKSENKRELALRDELIRLERLEHLASRFIKKAHLRETWIIENQHYIEQAIQLDDFEILLVIQKRHDALESDICAYNNRLNDLHFIASELDNGNYLKKQEIFKILQLVDDLWSQLLKTMTAKKSLIQNQIYALSDLTSCNSLLEWLRTIENRLISDRKLLDGSSIAGVDGLLRSHEMLETDIRTIYQKITEFILSNSSDNGLETGENLAQFDEAETTLRDAYTHVVDLAEANRSAIERTGHFWQVLNCLNREITWLQDKHILAKKLFTSFNTASFDKSIRMYKRFDFEIAEHKPAKDDALAKAQNLLRGATSKESSPNFYQDVSNKCLLVEREWKTLLERNSILKNHWSTMKKMVTFYCECDELDSWISSKLNMLHSSIRLAQQSSSSDTVDISSKCVREINSEIQEIIKGILNIENTGRNLISLSEQQLYSIKEKFLVNPALKDEMNDAQESHELLTLLVQERNTDINQSADILKHSLITTEYAFGFLIKLHQLLIRGNCIFNWIQTRNQSINEIIPEDLTHKDVSQMVGPEGEINGLILENLCSINYRFNKLEQELSNTAEQVALINSDATNLLTDFEENPDLHQLSEQKNLAVENLLKMLDSLNESWNKLADRFENFQSIVITDIEYIELCGETGQTIEWIEEKIKIVKSTDSIDINSLSGMIHLKNKLEGLHRDMTALEARICDLISRISKQNLSSKTNSQIPDALTKRHKKLTGLWNQLQQAHMSRGKRLEVGGEAQKYIQSLDNFESWLTKMQQQVVSFQQPLDLSDAERSLLHHRQCMQEISAYETDADRLLSESRNMASSQLDSLHGIILKQRLNQLSESWTAIKKISNARDQLLNQRLELEQFLRDHALLDVLMNQHATFLASCSEPLNLDAALEQRSQMDSFVTSFNLQSSKISWVLQKGNNLVKSSVRDLLPVGKAEIVINKCETLAKKSHEITNKSGEILISLEEIIAKFETVQLFDEFVEWIFDRKAWVMKSRSEIEGRTRDPQILELRFKIIEREIQNNVFKIDELKQITKSVIRIHPALQTVLEQHREQMLNNWDEFLEILRRDWQALAETVRESDLHDFLQSALKFTHKVDAQLNRLSSLKDQENSHSAAMIQSDLDQVQKLLKDEKFHSETLPFWENASKQLKQTFPEKAYEFELQLNNVESELGSHKAKLEKAEKQLQNALELARLRVQLKLEYAYAQDKLLELETLVRKRNVLGMQKPSAEPGQLLHFANQKKTALKNHLLEVENRKPRMRFKIKKFTEKIQDQTVNSLIDAQTEDAYENLINQTEIVWSELDLKLNQYQEIASAEVQANQLIFDASELQAWMLEKELSLVTYREPSNEATTLSFMSKHEQLALTIEQWSRNIADILRRAREFCNPSELFESLVPQDELKESQNAVKIWCELVKKTYGLLCDLSNETALQLEQKLAAFQLRSELEYVEEWLLKNLAKASSNDVGNDLESVSRHCNILLELSRRLDTEGSIMISSVTQSCDKLIMDQHAEAEAIALQKDRINELWADLKELLQTRYLMLSSNRDMHRFTCDCQHLQEQIEHRLKNLPGVPSDEVIADKPSKTSKKRCGLGNLQRSYAALDQELVCMGKQIDILDRTARQIIPLYAGDLEESLRLSISGVMDRWRQLVTFVDEGKLILEKATDLNRFLTTARELISWMEDTKNQIESQERPRDVLGVENLILAHRNLMEELKSRSKIIEDCLDHGRQLLPPANVPSSREDLIGPKGEVRERCVQLATGNLLLGELWRERWDRLHLLLEIRQFSKDSACALDWLQSKEIKLATARNKLGDNLTETLSLLGAHYAFERIIISAQDRFNSLKKLTALEISAMEWQAEDALKQEQRKRNKIRETVKEFMVPATQPIVIAPQSIAIPPSSLVLEPKLVPVQNVSNRKPLKAFPQTIELSERSISMATDLKKPLRGHSSDSPDDSATENSKSALASSRHKFLRSLPETTIQIPGGKELRKKVRRPRSKRPKKASIPAIDSEESKDREEISKTVSYSTGSSTTSSSIADDKFSQRLGTLEDFDKPLKVSSPVQNDNPKLENLHEKTSSSSKSSSSLTGFRSASVDTGRLPQDISQTIELKLPRLEGPLARKHDLDAGGRRRTKSEGRSWYTVYLVLDGYTLSTYKDHRSRRERPDVFFHNEASFDLAYAQSYVATDYQKHPFVFKLILSNSSEFLFRASSDEVMHKWISAINEVASIATRVRDQENVATKSSTLPRGSKSPNESLSSFSRRSLSRIFKR